MHGYADTVTPQKTQLMKPETAAKKLGVYLPATPPDFREGEVSRDELNGMIADPPEWLVRLRADGPHPRPVVAGKLGISISGLARGGITDPLTSVEIGELLRNQPAWLADERSTQAGVRREKERVAARDADRRDAD